MISWGFFAANLIGYGCGYINDQKQFRVPLGIQIVPAGLLLIGMFFLPYSPRWLAKQGREQEARDVLIRLHGGRKNARLDVIETEVQEMITQIEWGASFRPSPPHPSLGAQRGKASAELTDGQNARTCPHRTAT